MRESGSRRVEDGFRVGGENLVVIFKPGEGRGAVGIKRYAECMEREKPVAALEEAIVAA